MLLYIVLYILFQAFVATLIVAVHHVIYTVPSLCSNFNCCSIHHAIYTVPSLCSNFNCCCIYHSPHGLAVRIPAGDIKLIDWLRFVQLVCRQVSQVYIARYIESLRLHDTVLITFPGQCGTFSSWL